MGYEYFLSRADNKTLFELGKAVDGLYTSFPSKISFKIAELIHDDLANSLMKAAKEHGYWNEKALTQDYIEALSLHIVAWAGDSFIELVGENRAYELQDEEHYKITDTRYSADWHKKQHGAIVNTFPSVAGECPSCENCGTPIVSNVPMTLCGLCYQAEQKRIADEKRAVEELEANNLFLANKPANMYPVTGFMQHLLSKGFSVTGYDGDPLSYNDIVTELRKFAEYLAALKDSNLYKTFAEIRTERDE